jgi:uncharacterized Ntn-hydrolase superfamily protein
MTYSIVARDPDSGEMGVAVQSHYFSVGSVVTWGEAGIGVVATQAFAEVSYGPLGLDLMRGGKTAREALDALVATDQLSARRQVAMIDRSGVVAAHTGDQTLAEAAHRTGENYSVQANMMLKDTVPDAMAEAFERAEGDLTSKLLDALDAAEEQGGDIRGRQSAALLIVHGERAPHAAAGRKLELRIEDHGEPLVELRRLVGVRRAYDLMSEAGVRLASGEIDEAIASYEEAQALVPDNPEFSFWCAVTLAGVGEIDRAKPFAQRCFADGSGDWRELLRRLPDGGLTSAETMEKLES